MKISFNWLKQYFNTDLTVQEVSVLLTDCGLEVECVEEFLSVKGGLEGLVIGEVVTKEKHPDADKLSLTTVNIGAESLLNIVCGAANIASGQKVVVATVGAILHPMEGDAFQIKKSKIRGYVSEGMICSEDEIGLGSSHDGIMVLEHAALPGTPASEYFKVEKDYVLEIGLTPNRADAASHFGVARDLAAIVNTNPVYKEHKSNLALPDISTFSINKVTESIAVSVLDEDACPRYSGLIISGLTVTNSPEWLQNRLKAIGLKPINNVVDVTNYVLHELGQPLHAFDLDKISGRKIRVKKLSEKTSFTTLDKIDRKLSSDDLMICDDENPLCIAGVFGGVHSGVTSPTTSIFLESAYFNPVSVRKSSKFHGLKTDASFRFERGVDPEMTLYALKRAAVLLSEVAGGKVSSELIDIYPKKINNFPIDFNFNNCDNLIGKKIDRGLIKSIVQFLGIKVIQESETNLQLEVPAYKVDVKREVDVIEEVLRIYGYNNVEIPSNVHSSLSYLPEPDKEKLQDLISNLLVNKGFNEIINNSLTKHDIWLDGSVATKEQVKIVNPLSSDLGILRQSILLGGLESIVYNQNRKNADLKFFEFGKSYHLIDSTAENVTKKYSEMSHLGCWIVGKGNPELWNNKGESMDFYTMRGFVDAVCNRLGLTTPAYTESKNGFFEYGLIGKLANKEVIDFGCVNKALLEHYGIENKVFYADFDWDAMVSLSAKKKVMFSEIPKTQVVKRDLALLLNKEVNYSEVEELAFQTEKFLLKEMRLFDVYQGDKLPSGKKSYAVSFTLLDEEKTLTDKQIDKTMERIINSFATKLGAELRK